MARDRIGAHDMPLTRGTRLGPYEIESLIGSGGIGRGLQGARWTPESHGRDQTVDLRAGGRNPKDFVSEAVMHDVRRSGDSHRRRGPGAVCFARMPRSFSMSCVHRLLTVV